VSINNDIKWVRLARTSDFEKTRWKSYSILARKVGIVKRPDGSFYAIEVSCKHQNWDLTTGGLEGNIVTCPRHFWKYNIETGECLTHDSTRLRHYALKVEGEDIYVSLLPVEE
jgi:nitrite reductase/ring-hydroxylating ferredoxin subunit